MYPYGNSGRQRVKTRFRMPTPYSVQVKNIERSLSAMSVLARMGERLSEVGSRPGYLTGQDRTGGVSTENVQRAAARR